MSDAPADLTPFEFEGVDGNTYELPDLREFSPRQLQAASHGDLDALEEALRTNGADEDAIEAFMSLSFRRIDTLIQEWAKGSGKASGSSPSSNGTATRSKRTSKSGGSRSRR